MALLPPFSRPLIATTAALVALAGCGGGSNPVSPADQLAIAGLLNPPTTTPPTTPPPTSETTPPVAGNTAPVSNAGAAQTVKAGVAVTLDGNASSDADGDKLTFAWTLASKPDGSTASLTGTTSATPTFMPDVSGTYVASLIVNDGKVDSAASTVTVTVEAVKAVAFDGTPATLPSNVVSVGFEASQINSLGDRITLAADTPRMLSGISLVMSSQACQNYPATACETTAGTTFVLPIKVRFFDGNTPIAEKEQTFAIPFRPSADPTCPNQQWRDACKRMQVRPCIQDCIRPGIAQGDGARHVQL